jgi:cell division protein FtsL
MMDMTTPILANSISTTIQDNVMLLIVAAFLTILAIVGLIVANQYSKYTTRVKLDQLEQNLEKLKRYAQVQKRKALRDSISMLKPDEREHLYRLWEDNSVISRKTIFKLNELEDRIRRSERGAELKWAESRITELSDTEKKLFPEQFPEYSKKKRR